MRAADVLALQSAAGNRAARTVAETQRSMNVGAAGDSFEREADAVAREIVGGSGAAPAQREAEEEELQAKHVQREAEEDELQAKHVQREAEEDELQAKHLQRDASPEVGMDGGSASAETTTAIENSRGGGSPLSPSVRGEMEGAFGADFGGVRVHEGAEAADLNQRLSARAFTTGNDIFIGQGGLNAGSRGGKELLAHELTHVVQQGGAARKTRRKP
jgi:hypothetical protein